MGLKLDQFILGLSKEAVEKYLFHTLHDIEESVGFLKAPDDESYEQGFFAFIDNLSQSNFGKIYSDFDLVDCLTCDNIGSKALESSIQYYSDDTLIETFHKSDNLKDFTLDLLKTHRDIIEYAFAIYHEGKFTQNSAKWNMFYLNAEKSFTVSFKEKGLDDFKDDIIKTYKKKNPFAKIAIKWIPRLQGNQTVQHAIIYKQGNPKSFQTLDDKERLKPITIREAVESSLMYDLEKGIVHIMGEGGQAQHQNIALSFKKHLTDCLDDNHIETLSKRNINFNLFKKPVQFEIPPDSTVKSVQVEGIKISDNCSTTEKPSYLRSAFECTTNANDPPNMLYNMIKNIHSSTYDTIGNWNIKKVTLRVYFKKDKSDSQKLGKSVKFDLMSPNTHNLKALTARHEYILENLLDLWRIFDSD